MRYDDKITLLYGDGSKNVFGESTDDVKEEVVRCNLRNVDLRTQMRVTGETDSTVLIASIPHRMVLPDRARVHYMGRTHEFRIRSIKLLARSTTCYLVRDAL